MAHSLKYARHKSDTSSRSMSSEVKCGRMTLLRLTQLYLLVHWLKLSRGYAKEIR